MKATNGIFLALLAGSIAILTGYAFYVFVHGLTDLGWLLIACDVVAVSDFVLFWREK